MKTEVNDVTLSRSFIVFGVLIAAGLVLGAFVLGNQTKHIGSGRSAVSVKGLAEKQIKADTAEWGISVETNGPTLAEALTKLRKEKKDLDQFIEKQGFDASMRSETMETAAPRFVEKMVNGREIKTQEGFTGTQTIVITCKALDKIIAARKAVVDFKAAGHDITYNEPSYLVSNLEDIKMSLISDATQNARKRAEEFIRTSDSKIGHIISASQGTFNILSNTVGDDEDRYGYGGKYDKTTIDKIVRLVVTVDFDLR